MNSCDIGHYSVLKQVAIGCRSFLEIGVQEGGSLKSVLDAEPKILDIVLADTWDYNHGGTGRGSGDHILKMLDSMNYKGSIEFLNGKSQNTIPSIKDRVFDLVHVDGDHSYDCALQDITNCWPLTRKYLVIHDTSFPDVWKAIHNFGVTVSNAFAWSFFGDYGTIVIGRTVIPNV